MDLSQTNAVNSKSRLLSFVQKNRWILTAATFLLMALIFGVAHNQSILFEGNQNTKFLHGLAHAGLGYLKEDWMANTVDPLPTFSYLVTLTYLLEKKLFYVYYILFLGVYIFSLVGILRVIFPVAKDEPRSRLARSLLLFAVLVFLHSKLLAYLWTHTRFLSGLGLPVEFLQYGVAEQYLLGPEFQNSLFGVFLLLSLYLFLKRKYLWTFICLAFTCIFHSAYLLSAGLLAAVYCLTILSENIQRLGGRKALNFGKFVQAVKQPFLYGLVTLIPILPVLYYTNTALGGTTPETNARAMWLITHEAIPFHSLFSVWWNKEAWVQCGLMLIGLALAWRTRLFPAMLALALGGLALTLVQIATASDDLALLSPWRVTVLLVPLSTALIVDWLIRLAFGGLDKARLPYTTPVLVLAALLVGYTFYRGVLFQKLQFDNYRNLKVAAAFNYVKNNKKPGEVYLIPPYDPEFNDFRVYTGAPTYINWKTHPYKDLEVIEWDRRVQEANRFYEGSGEAACAALKDLAAEGVTHVLTKGKDEGIPCSFVTELDRINRFAIYKINLP